MIKITFIGAGSTVFAKNVLGDTMLTTSLASAHIALYDIDENRLRESEAMLNIINKNCNEGKAKIVAYSDRREALSGADFIVNAIQVGGYRPSTVIDFEIPKKYGLRQTIADTIGIGGLFRALRTIPVLESMARDIEAVCPTALFINYTNPMSVLSGYLQRYSQVRTVGVCHSVQCCAETILNGVGLPTDNVIAKIAGINHMAWLLEVSRNGEDLYPEIKKRAAAITDKHYDMVRHEIMKQFGYYITESSEHLSEYLPYFIKKGYPELIERFGIPLDEYPRRCEEQIRGWESLRDELVSDPSLTHVRTNEYASYIMEAVVTNKAIEIGGNVLNTGLITNLPAEACVEVPCLVNAKGISPCYVGKLPEQLAALNRTNINTHLLTIEAAVTRRKEHIYHAALLDPHTAAELPIDSIIAMCDELIAAHGDYLPKYQ
ncbi:MAG: alpha-glucosidase/alpha-galactosidase [Lachnospiraceae bacterium]|jgi:alpha-galactosidase|nr:alpha-glucosidase/alpha-galactosidase [Lachnospiraceae bacterium]